MTDKKLIQTIKSFVKGLLSGKPTTDMCFMVCSPLVTYLNGCGIKCDLTEGELQKRYHHFWITLEDGRVIDPTADQFGLLNIYVRKQPSYYRKYTSADYDKQIKSALKRAEKHKPKN